ncbi:DUF3667 domain-containing protein [Ekhidna sp.]
MSKPNPSNCLNCGSKTEGNYCNNCSQSASIQRITFRDTLDDFFSSTFALQGPLLSTIKFLMVDPGKLLRSFIEGKRKSYYKPVSFFVLLTAIYLILRSVIGYDPFEGQPQMEGENVHELARVFINAGKYMVAHINHIMFFLVFSIGISNKLFFSKKYNLAEYLTVGFYVSGIYILIGIIYMLFSVYVIFIPPQLNMVFLFLYIVYISFSFHRQKSFLAIIKYLLLSLFSILLYVILGFGFSLLRVW